MRTVCRDIAKQRPVRQTGVSSTVVDIMTKAKAVGVEIFLPVDSVTAGDAYGTSVVDCEDDLPSGVMELDCGPITRAINVSLIQTSGTIIWNGPIGRYEMKPFEAGSKHMMEDIVEATCNGATTIVTGRDTVDMFKAHHRLHEVTHFNVWSEPFWNLLMDNRLLGIDTLSGPLQVWAMHLIP